MTTNGDRRVLASDNRFAFFMKKLAAIDGIVATAYSRDGRTAHAQIGELELELELLDLIAVAHQSLGARLEQGPLEVSLEVFQRGLVIHARLDSQESLHVIGNRDAKPNLGLLLSLIHRQIQESHTVG